MATKKKSRSRNKSYTPKNKLKKVRGGATMTLFWSRCVKREQNSMNFSLILHFYVPTGNMSTIFDKTCWEFCSFLPTERLAREFGAAMTPPLTPLWSMLFSQGQKLSNRTSTLFFLEVKGEGEGFVVAIACLVLICRWSTCDIAAGTACDTTPTYEDITPQAARNIAGL